MSHMSKAGVACESVVWHAVMLDGAIQGVSSVMSFLDLWYFQFPQGGGGTVTSQAEEHVASPVRRRKRNSDNSYPSAVSYQSQIEQLRKALTRS